MNNRKTPSALNANTVVRSAEGIVSCDLAGEEAILNLDSGMYYGLNGVGSAIWRQIREPARLGDVVDRIVAEYAVTPERCEVDVIGLVGQLIEHGMARVVA